MRLGRRFFASGALLCFMFGIAFSSADVFASGAAPGTDPSGGTCSRHFDTCYGLHWQMYERNDPNDSTPLVMSWTNSTGGPVNIYGCTGDDKVIYNYGYTGYRGAAWEGFQLATARGKYWKQTPESWLFPARGAYPGDSCTLSYCAHPGNMHYLAHTVGYVTMDEARQAFLEMKEYLSRPENASLRANFYGWDTSWENVGAFCWHKYGERSLTVKYEGYEDDRCNMVQSGMHEISASQKVFDNQDGDMEGNEGTIRLQTKIQQLIDEGWELDGKDVPEAVVHPAGYMGNSTDFTIQADVQNGPVTVTIKFKKVREGCTTIPPGPCGDWTPRSYLTSNIYHGHTSVLSVVKNGSLTNENSEWHGSGNAENGPALKESENKFTYAKPSDTVNWYHCYYPGAYTTANTLGSINNYHDPHSETAPFVDSSITNKPLKQHSWWPRNEFWINSTFLNPAFNYHGGAYAADDYNAEGKEKGNDYYVKPSNLHAGETLRESIWTNGPTDIATNNEGVHSWGCHRDSHVGTRADGTTYTYEHLHDTCKHDKDFWRYTTSTGSEAKDTTTVQVPYNFLNDVVATIASGDPVYEAETIQLDQAKIHVGTRQNDETQGNYATEVEQIGKAKIIAFLEGPGWTSDQLVGVSKQDNYGNSISDGYIWNNDSGESICAVTNAKYGLCRDLESRDGTFNEQGKMEGDDVINVSGGTYNVFDEAAGNQYCVAAAIYPYTVKNTGDEKDKDMDRHGDHAWLMSEPQCRTIAKKPNFQVWGAGVFSNGSVQTRISTKNNIKGFSEWAWRPKPETPNAIFSSWGELTLTIGGTTSTMASGASTGHTGGTGGSSDPGTSRQVSDTGRPGGLKDGADFCKRSPMSIANEVGSGVPTCQGNAGIAGGFMNNDTLFQTFTADNLALTEMLAEYPGVNKEDTAYIGGASLGVGETRVNIHQGTVTIDGTISYPDIAYTSPQQIPKYIIYAKGGDIRVSCNVKRVDAILLTDNGFSVDTCYQSSDSGWNDAARSNQLVVTGAISTGKLNLKRSYGTGVGAYSIVPAELINYDSSLYLWANSQSEGATSGQMSETAIRELAPRY